MMRRTIVARRAIVSNFLRSPSEKMTFTQVLTANKANGTDMASNLTSDFVSLQAQLVKYRIVRLGDEISHLLSNPSDGIPSFAGFVVSLVFLYVWYNVGIIVGRFDLHPLERPSA